MTSGAHTREPEAGAARPFSVHRAFVYSAAVPGWGSWYAGQRVVASIGFVGVGVLLLWFFASLARILSTLIGQFMAILDETPRHPASELPTLALGASVLGLYLLWLGFLALAVDGAVRTRAGLGLLAQRSVPWAVGMAWLCPGTGQLYLGARALGFTLVAISALAQLLLIPAYQTMIHDALALAQGGTIAPSDVAGWVDAVHSLQLRVDYGTGRVLAQLCGLLGMGLALDALRGALPARPTGSHAAGLLLVGWLCPGGAQLLHGRRALGAGVLGLYLGSLGLLALLFGSGALGPTTLDRLEWWLIALQWGAMIEAVVRLPLQPRRAR